MAKNILNICHQVQDILLSSNMKTPPSLTGHFCAPPFDYLVMIIIEFVVLNPTWYQS